MKTQEFIDLVNGLDLEEFSDILIEDYSLAFPELEEALKETMSSVMSNKEIEQFF